MITLTDISSLEFYRCVQQQAISNLLEQQRSAGMPPPSKPATNKLSPTRTPNFARPTRKELDWVLSHYGSYLTQPIHVMIPDQAFRLRHPAVVNHVCSTVDLANISLRIEPHMAVVLPEICFAYLAASLPPAQALMVGMELCGAYRINRFAERGFTNVSPLTTQQAIARTLRGLSGTKSLNNGRQLVRYLHNDSRSPMESALATILSLPIKRGGQGFPPMQLNARLSVPKEAYPLVNSRYLLADLLWEEQRVIVEYDGILDHTGAERITQDAGRRIVLESMGFTVMTLTKKQVCNWQSFLAVKNILDKYLGIRRRSSKYDWSELQHQLWRDLLFSR
ncbi:DUF559 domain-containing protein [Eggerthellaceae bacterium 3-80]|nr:DUF559 domain-containing protein [bacterium D16-34]